jgi:hypothetical protein
MVGATCCEDKEHCCPADLPICDTDEGRCLPKPVSGVALLFMLFMLGWCRKIVVQSLWCSLSADASFCDVDDMCCLPSRFVLTYAVCILFVSHVQGTGGFAKSVPWATAGSLCCSAPRLTFSMCPLCPLFSHVQGTGGFAKSVPWASKVPAQRKAAPADSFRGSGSKGQQMQSIKPMAA